MAFDLCGPYHDSYFQYVIFIPLTVLFQFLLLVNSAHHRDSMRKIQWKIRWLYLFLQVMAFCFLFTELFQNLILSNSIQPNENVIYGAFISFNTTFVILCYWALLMLFFVRIIELFKCTGLALNPCSIRMFFAYLCVPPAITQLIIIVWQGEACIWIWKPMDLDTTKYLLASNVQDPLPLIGIYLSMFWMISANIAIGILFYVKLKGLMAMDSSSSSVTDPDHLKIKKLMIKNSLLTFGCIVSTLCSWMIYVLLGTQHLGFLIYVDLCVNCFFAGLMFRFNRKIYNQVCGCCARKFIKMSGQEAALQSLHSLSPTPDGDDSANQSTVDFPITAQQEMTATQSQNTVNDN